MERKEKEYDEYITDSDDEDDRKKSERTNDRKKQQLEETEYETTESGIDDASVVPIDPSQDSIVDSKILTRRHAVVLDPREVCHLSERRKMSSASRSQKSGETKQLDRSKRSHEIVESYDTRALRGKVKKELDESLLLLKIPSNETKLKTCVSGKIDVTSGKKNLKKKSVIIEDKSKMCLRKDIDTDIDEDGTDKPSEDEAKRSTIEASVGKISDGGKRFETGKSDSQKLLLGYKREDYRIGDVPDENSGVCADANRKAEMGRSTTDEYEECECPEQGKKDAATGDTGDHYKSNDSKGRESTAHFKKDEKGTKGLGGGWRQVFKSKKRKAKEEQEALDKDEEVCCKDSEYELREFEPPISEPKKKQRSKPFQSN